jgi:leader peptidase (prepilin peptidase)/N-methyltransferase
MQSLVLVILLLGLAVGSFLNVVVYRVLHGGSPFQGRSRCPKCKHKIAWYDNIPLLSFLLLRGRCRWCKKRISLQYPVLEGLVAALFVWWYVMGRFFFRLTKEPYQTLQPLFWLMVGLFLLLLVVADLFYGLWPDIFVVLLLGLTLVYRLLLALAGVMQWADFGIYCFSGVAAGVAFLLLVLGTRGKGMGWGDVKLVSVMGLILGWPKILVAVMVAFLTGAVAGLILVVTGKKNLKQTIPFGPFLIGGTVVALIWGQQVWSGYVNLLGL